MGGPFWVSRNQSGWPLGVGSLCQLETQLAQDFGPTPSILPMAHLSPEMTMP